MVFGRLAGKDVAVMQGRMHHYEGYSYEEVSYARAGAAPAGVRTPWSSPTPPAE